MRRGFTLIEGLVSMFILTVVFFAAIGLYPSSVLANLQAADQITAHAIAQRVLEDVRMQDFRIPAVGDNTLADQTVDGKVFHVQESVLARAADLKQITVTVSWTGHTLESISAQTAIFNYEGGTP